MVSRIRRKALMALLPGALAAASLMAAPAVAGAEEAGTQGWRGQCWWNVYTSPGISTGWCDGNGPESYRAWVSCANGYTYYGVTRWHGDRRGSTAACPGGGTATGGGYQLL